MNRNLLLIIATIALSACGGRNASGGAYVPSTSSVHAASHSNGDAVSIHWSSLGPQFNGESGKLNAIAFGPKGSNTLYVGGGIGQSDDVTTSTGVFKSTDGGQTWASVNYGLRDMTINSLLDTPTGTLLAATETGGIYRSTDEAHSWSQRSNAQSVRQLMLVGSKIYAAAASGVYRSTDDGASWSLIWPLTGNSNPGVCSLGRSGSTIFIGMEDGSFFASVANGMPTRLGNVPHFNFWGNTVHQIVADATNTKIVYASVVGILYGIYSDGLARSINGGRSWLRVSLRSSIRGAQGISAVPKADSLYVAGTGLATISMPNNARTYHRHAATGDSRTVTPDPYKSGYFYVLGDQGAFYGTISQGTSVTSGLRNNIVRSVSASGTEIIATMQDFAPVVSGDGGATWHAPRKEPISLWGSENGTAYINPSRAKYCYVLVSGGIYVSTDACQTFKAFSNVGPPLSWASSIHGQIAAIPSSSKIYAVTTRGIFLADDGEHFKRIRWPIPNPSFIAIDPRDGQHILVAAGDKLFASTNGGGKFATSTGLSPGNAVVAAFDPVHKDVVLAYDSQHIYRSVDAGVAFKMLPTSLPSITPAAEREDALLRHRVSEQSEPSAASVSPMLGEFQNAPDIAIGAISGRRSLAVFIINGSPYVSWDEGNTIHNASTDATSAGFEAATFWNGRLCVGTDGAGVLCSQPL